jgi:hypothetical protein
VRKRVVNIRDPELRRHVAQASAAVGGLPDALRPVFGLMSGIDLFRHTEGEESSRVAEAVTLLLSEDLRPALRLWYQSFGNNMNQAAVEFRDHLSRLAQEEFGR